MSLDGLHEPRIPNGLSGWWIKLLGVLLCLLLGAVLAQIAAMGRAQDHFMAGVQSVHAKMQEDLRLLRYNFEQHEIDFRTMSRVMDMNLRQQAGQQCNTCHVKCKTLTTPGTTRPSGDNRD